MPQTYFLPLTFTLSSQEPKSTSDTPSAPVQGGATGGTSGGTVAPGAPQTQPASQENCASGMWYMMPAMLLIMYFMVLRPDQKRRKAQQALLSSIKQGDRVVTIGGMHGVVAKLADKTVTLRIDTMHMTFDRSAVARVERDDVASAPPAKS